MDFDTQFFASIFPKLMLKIPYTLCLGCVAFAIAFVLGLFLEICFTSRFKILRTLAGLYISYFRSTPYITQLFIFYFGLPQIFPVMRILQHLFQRLSEGDYWLWIKDREKQLCLLD